MSITQEIDLNLIPSSAPVIVHLNQYDEGKGRIIAHLYNGSNPYVPGVNATVKVQGTKPDKHAFQYWCDIDGSTVTVDVNVQMTAVAGLVPTQLIVNETSGITGSFAFQLDVQASTLPSNIDVSETDLPILTEEAQEAARRAVQAAASAEEAAEEAAGWSANPPYIGENRHWYVYDTETEQFVDSGVIAEGQDGEPGNKWYKGTAISGESSTPTVFPSSGITLAYHNDFYLNTTEGSIYHCETPGDASTATWVYDFKLTGGGSGGVTNYNDLTNKPKIGGVELTGNKTIADLGGVQSFNGRSGSILPVAGDYKSDQIILASIMHIGGGTQDDVQEALEALDSKDAGGSTITVTTAEVTLRGKNVTLSDGVNTWTKQFDNTGKAIFTSIMSTGALSVTASDGTETASGTISAPYFGNYTCPIAFFEAVVTVYGGTGMLGGCPVVAKKDGVVVASGVLSNIFGQPSEYVFHLNQPGTYTFEVTNDWRTFASDPATYSVSGTYNATVNGFETDVVVSTTSSEFKGKDVTVTCAGVPTSTIRLDASLGSAVYKALMPGTYTFSLTYQGTVYTTSAVVTVTDTQISAPPLALWTATLAITTSSSSLYGKTITIKKGSTVVGTTAFSAQGSASYTVHETGTYTCECEGYSGSATVSAETTYNVTINTVETYHLTVDIYSAASDTLSYTDDNGAQTVTTDSTGKATGVSITITQPSVGVDPTITFTSSVAKDPDNLSNDYSKSVTVTDGTSEIYVMPDNALYWWGYRGNIEDVTTANGWSDSRTLVSPTYSTNSVVTSSGSNSTCYVGSKNKITASKAYAIGTNTGTDASYIASSPSKSLGTIDRGFLASSGISKAEISSISDSYIIFGGLAARSATWNAAWYE